MAERPSVANIRGLLLFAVTWTQTVSFHHGIFMKVEAIASKRIGGRFNVPGLGNILELPFDLDLMRSELSKSVELPNDTSGFVACYDNKPDEAGIPRTVIGGQLALPEAVFDDLWERVRIGPEFRCSIAMKVGPVTTPGLEGSMWDRAKDKHLYVMDIEFSFLRDGKLLDH